MAGITEKPAPTPYEYSAWVITGVVLLIVLKLHLLPAFLAGFLVYALVHSLAPLLHIGSLSGERAKVLIVAFISIVVAVLLTLLIWGISAYFRSDSGSISALFKMMAEILEKSQMMLPAWLVDYLPKDAEELRISAINWLNEHASALPLAGKEAARIMALILIGMVVGAMISLMQARPMEDFRPLSRALVERVKHLHLAFRQIVFAQARIAALNTFFTGMYLAVALPLFDIHLPLTKTLVAITFITGLLPVVGNLISNTVIVVVSLSVSLGVAVASLIFLVVIHKLEYFLNAYIIGAHIHSRAWELLLAMLVMEAAFGLSGLIVAPIYYAYIKNELSARGLI